MTDKSYVALRHSCEAELVGLPIPRTANRSYRMKTINIVWCCHNSDFHLSVIGFHNKEKSE